MRKIDKTLIRLRQENRLLKQLNVQLQNKLKQDFLTVHIAKQQTIRANNLEKERSKLQQRIDYLQERLEYQFRENWRLRQTAARFTDEMPF